MPGQENHPQGNMGQVKAPRPFTGKTVFWYLFAFFAVIIVANLILFYLATSSNPGVVSEDAYQRGLSYNQIIKLAEEQKKLGWTHELKLVRDLGNDFRVSLQLKDKQGKRISQARVKLRFYHPVKAGDDFDITLKESRPGLYKGLVKFPMLGRWDAYVAVRTRQHIYRAYEHLKLP